MKTIEKEMEGLSYRFIGRFDNYRDMLKNAAREKGNTAVCYVKIHSGLCTYRYYNKHWLLMYKPKKGL